MPKIEDAKRICKVLISHGFENVVPCGTAASALIAANDAEKGLIISGYRLPDMYYTQLSECIPKYYELLLVGSLSKVSEAEGSVMALATPLKIYELVNTVEMMLTQVERRYKKDKKRTEERSEKDIKDIQNAKRLLMERNHLTEEAAYRYIQKCSMDNGVNMAETAQMILMLIDAEC
nr:ANTAR domain-containing protein [Mediterraneibacter hominis]